MNSKKGMTLVELVVSLLLASLIVVTGTELYRTVIRTTVQLESSTKDWSRQLFLRDQVRTIDALLMRKYPRHLLDKNNFSFITRNSAQHGKFGQPMIVLYKIEKDKIVYSEYPVLPWWETENEVNVQGNDRMLAGVQSKRNVYNWSDTFYTNAEKARFAYWDITAKQWKNEWSDTKTYPPLVRLTMTRFGREEEILLKTQDSSLFLPFGSSLSQQPQ